LQNLDFNIMDDEGTDKEYQKDTHHSSFLCLGNMNLCRHMSLDPCCKSALVLRTKAAFAPFMSLLLKLHLNLYMLPEVGT
jgi:hypothetical protein